MLNFMHNLCCYLKFTTHVVTTKLQILSIDSDKLLKLIVSNVPLVKEPFNEQ